MGDCSDFIERAKASSVRSHGEIIGRLVVDTKTGDILFVPSDINHPEFTAAHMGKDVTYLKQHPADFTRFVGANSTIVNGIVTEVFVGVSGLETVLLLRKKPFHTKEEVNAAREMLMDCLLRAGVPLSPTLRIRVVYV